MNQHHAPLRRAATLALALATAAAAASALTACRGDRSSKPPRQFFPDLDDQPKYLPQTRSSFFTDYLDEETGQRYGRSQRLPVAGTVPFARIPHVRYEQGAISEFGFNGNDYTDRRRLAAIDEPFMTGKPVGSTATLGDPAGDWLEKIPLTVDHQLIELGKTNYNIYCLPCHGGLGAGDGTVGTRWSYTPANLQGEQYLHGGEKGDDGYLFNVILHGVPNPALPYQYAMRGYAGKVSEHEAWAIVAYLRVLQQSQRGTIDMLPPTQREALSAADDNEPTAAPRSSNPAPTAATVNTPNAEGEAAS
ncbi:MAG: c-type cytochrome [Phycisphaerales bacterium]